MRGVHPDPDNSDGRRSSSGALRRHAAYALLVAWVGYCLGAAGYVQFHAPDPRAICRAVSTR